MEGFGEEFYYLFLTSFIFIIVLAFIFFKHQSSRGMVHPDNDNLVRTVRSEMNTTPSNNSTSNQCCPICLADAIYPIQTNCGHIFCGKCIIAYWNVGRWNGAVKCPSCRQLVTMLLKCFQAPTSSQEDLELNSIISDINRYNHRFSGQSVPLLDYLSDMPTMLQHCWQDLLNGRLDVAIRARIILSIVAFLFYLLLPFDLIPEAVLGVFGFIDDLFSGIVLLIYANSLYRSAVGNLAM